MARNPSAYDNIEAAIVATLSAEVSPFRTVQAYGSHLSDADLVKELHKLLRVAPAALVCYAGGQTNCGLAGSLDEEATFSVICVAAARTPEAAAKGDDVSPGIYRLLEYCREQLHNVTDIAGINNPLLCRGNRRVVIPGHLLTVAAWACDFRGDLNYPDGPT